MSPPQSDSDDGSSDEEKSETENSKLTKEELQKSISQFEESLIAHKNWIEAEEENPESLREDTAISEGEDDQEILNAIEELEPDSETELARRIDSVIHWAQEEVKKLETRNSQNEDNQPSENPSFSLQNVVPETKV